MAALSLTACLGVALLVQTVAGSGQFYIKFFCFYNPNNRDSAGDSCDRYVWLFSNPKCDTIYNFCLGLRAGDCSLLNFQSPEYENQPSRCFAAPRTTFGMPNPYVWRFTEWPGSLTFRFRARDEDSVGAWDDIFDMQRTWQEVPALYGRQQTIQRDYTNSRLRMSFRLQRSLYCDQHWYGSRCTVYCRPRSSPVEGYYTCSSSGAKICHSAWEGASCNIYKDDCHNHKCQHGATCVDRFRAYSCVCDAGYTGTHCETNINECASNPCLHGGRCNDLINKFTCTCFSPYEGLYCESHFCEVRSPCRNGGTCYDNGQ